MVIKRNRFLVGLFGLLIAAACGSTPTTGTLEVEVNAPDGVLPSITVQGNNFSKNIAQAGVATFSDLVPGTYTINTQPVTSSSGLLYKATVSASGTTLTAQSVNVVAGSTAKINVDYVESAPQLQVTLSVASELSSFKPKLTLNGPAGSLDISASQTLDTLPAGTYSVSATDAPSGYLRSLSASSITLAAGKTTQVSLSYGRNMGSLAVQISADPGCTPSVAVNQGNNLVQTLSASTTLNNLPVGSYSVVPAASSGCSTTAVPSSLNVQNGLTAGPSVVTYTRLGSISVNLSGLPSGTAASITLIPQSGSPITQSGSGSVVFNNLAPGQYSLSAKSLVVSGSVVDSYYLASAPSPGSITLSSGSPTASSSLSYVQRSDSGQIWVAGNGQFSNGGRGATTLPENNGAYTIGDAALSSGGNFNTFIAPSSSQGLFRIAFDQGGNMYQIYQYNSASSYARVIRISQQNLRNNQLSETAPGNTVITGSVWAWPDYVTPDPTQDVSTNEPADLAFDKNGNLWVVNDNLGLFGCVAASKLNAAPASITTSDARIWGPGTGLYHYVLNTVGQNADDRPFMIPHSMAFDYAGNMWFTAGGYQGNRPSETSPVKRSSLNRLNKNFISYATNGDCNGGDVGLTASTMPNWIDIRLDISLAAADMGSIVKPVTMTLEPGGQAIWVGDYGGNTPSPSTYDYYRDANAQPETVIRVPLSGSNLTQSPNIQPASVSHRVTVSAGNGGDKGLQQVFGLAFDKNGYLWTASNNNVEILTSDTWASAALTDRKGKLYQLDVRNITSQPSYTGNNSLDLRPQNPKTFSVPDTGVGLIGVAISLPNPSALPNIYPSR